MANFCPQDSHVYLFTSSGKCLNNFNFWTWAAETDQLNQLETYEPQIFLFYKQMINKNILEMREFVHSLFIMIVTSFTAWNRSRNLKNLLNSRRFWPELNVDSPLNFFTRLNLFPTKIEWNLLFFTEHRRKWNGLVSGGSALLWTSGGIVPPCAEPIVILDLMSIKMDDASPLPPFKAGSRAATSSSRPQTHRPITSRGQLSIMMVQSSIKYCDKK